MLIANRLRRIYRDIQKTALTEEEIEDIVEICSDILDLCAEML